MEISDDELMPCPTCGGMTLLVHVPRGAVIWCSECERTLAETSYDGDFSKEKDDMAASKLARLWNSD